MTNDKLKIKVLLVRKILQKSRMFSMLKNTIY